MRVLRRYLIMQTLRAFCSLFLIRFAYVLSAKDTAGKPIPLEISDESSEDKLHLTQDDFVVRSRKSGGDDVWPWDIWCQLQPILVNKDDEDKNQSSTKYYYDRQIDKCRPYNYTGVRNKNSFQRKENCERYCLKSANVIINHMNERSRLVCSLQYDSGPCFSVINASSTLLYYDINEQACKNFTYSGCGGNHNRFYSNKTCYSSCGNTEIPMLKEKNMTNKEINGTLLRKSQGNVTKVSQILNKTHNSEKLLPSRKSGGHQKHDQSSGDVVYEIESVEDELNFNLRRSKTS